MRWMNNEAVGRETPGFVPGPEVIALVYHLHCREDDIENDEQRNECDLDDAEPVFQLTIGAHGEKIDEADQDEE